MDKHKIEYYIEAVRKLRDEAARNVSVRDQLYDSIMIDLDQFLIFCNAHLSYRKICDTSINRRVK